MVVCWDTDSRGVLHLLTGMSTEDDPPRFQVACGKLVPREDRGVPPERVCPDCKEVLGSGPAVIRFYNKE